MLLIVISTGILFVVITALVAWAQINTGRSQAMEDALLEGATLSNLPSLEDLLYEANALDTIKENVVEVGFNFQVTRERYGKHNTAEVFVIDDGGGVHILKRVDHTDSMAPIARLETQAAELAQLLDVPLR